jgi:hypothetical protein
MGAQSPVAELQLSVAPQVPLAAHAPPLQISFSFCALPLHPSAGDPEHAQPSAIVPVPQPEFGTHCPFEHMFPGVQGVPFATGTQVPAVPHCWQAGQPDTVQQRLLTQLPVEQSPAPEQVSPALSLHIPPATQVRVPVQVSSSPLVTVLHEPAVLAQL